MEKEAIYSPRAPRGRGAYTPAVKVGPWIYVSGQIPIDPTTNEITGTTVEEQTHRILTNIRELLETGGSSLDQVVKVTAYLANLQDFDAYNRVYATYFTGVLPARTTIQAGLRGILVEIDVIAVAPDAGAGAAAAHVAP